MLIFPVCFTLYNSIVAQHKHFVKIFLAKRCDIIKGKDNWECEMNKKTGIIVGILIVAFAALVGVSVWQRNQGNNQAHDYNLTEITEMAAQNNYDQYDLNKIIAASEASGNLPENVNGSEDAEVVIFEYGDYQCSYCAAMNPLINEIVKDYNGKVAVVLRTYVLSYHDNGVQAASAANAAAIQGYWKEMKDLLFTNQDVWFYSKPEKLQEQLEEYFMEASQNKGDLEKFRADMESDEMKQKLAFDQGLGDKAEIGGTPWFYMDGEWIDNKDSDGKGMQPSAYAKRMRELIDAKLK